MRHFNNLHPTEVIRSVEDIDVRWFEENHIKGVVFDLDRTLTGHNDLDLPIEVVELIKNLHKIGMKIGILSNARSKKRKARFSQMMKKLDVYEPVGVVAKPDSGKAKPSRVPFDYIAKEIGANNRYLCYIGDQIYKDIYGAMRSGYGAAILVSPRGVDDHPGVKYFQRPLLEIPLKVLFKIPIKGSKYPKKLDSKS